jgi:hypothetical protein
MKTFAQVVISLVAVGSTFHEVALSTVWQAALVAAILSIFTSMVGLPEVGSDGKLVVNTTDPNKDIYKLEVNGPLEDLADKSKVTLKVTK